MVKKRIKAEEKHKGGSKTWLVKQHNMIGKTSGIPEKFGTWHITDFEKVTEEMDQIEPLTYYR